MRYFFISFSHYTHTEDGTVFGDGNITVQTEGAYPNQAALLRDIKEKEPEIENITILNIIEMSEQDFKDFTTEA